MSDKPRCPETTKKGTPCQANPRADTGKCNAHSPKEVQESSGFGGPQSGSGRPRTPRVVDVIRERIEQDMEPVISALVDALNADSGLVVGNGAQARVEFEPDHKTRIAAARELLDRAYGKAKQISEVSGPEGGPIHTEGTVQPGPAYLSEGVQEAAARLLAEAAEARRKELSGGE
jgi:hypothetical protein